MGVVTVRSCNWFSRVPNASLASTYMQLPKILAECDIRACKNRGSSLKCSINIEVLTEATDKLLPETLVEALRAGCPPISVACPCCSA